MPKLKNKKTGVVYDVTQDDLVKIMSSSTWGGVYTEVKEPKKPEPKKEAKDEKEPVKVEPKDVKKAAKVKKTNK